MGFLKWFRKDKKDKEKKEKKSKDKGVESVLLPPKEETEDQKRAKVFDEYLNKLVAEGKEQGLTDEGAKKRAWKIIEKKLEKQRLQGIPIVCSVCKKYGSNKETGGLRKNEDGTYRHQNCSG